MLRLLQLIFLGHWHTWETVKVMPLKSITTEAQGERYTLRCKTCGQIKKVDLI